MHLIADDVYTQPREDDYPDTVGFRGSNADYCVILSRFSDLEPDTGMIEVVVRDQVCTRTAILVVRLSRSTCSIFLDIPTATKLLDVAEYTIAFSVCDDT